jgi:hypothetical protein
MTTLHKLEQKPWQPIMEHEPEFNPFVNPMDRVGQLESQPPLEDVDSNEIESEEAQAAVAAPIAPSLRHSMIAQAAYLLAEHRGFGQDGELQDWLVAEAQIDVSLASRQPAERFLKPHS